MQIYELMQTAGKKLVQAGIDEAVEVDVQLLLSHCLEKTRTELFLLGDSLVDPIIEKQFYQLLERRINREPVAYILGEQEFWSLDFEVTPDVLIPRPETEFLLEQVLRYSQDYVVKRSEVLDLCTGSGAIAIVLAKELGQKITAVDVSLAALNVARRNCRRHQVETRVDLIESDLFSNLPKQQQFGLIVSNPPYISTQDVDYSLAPEVGVYEPRLALDGGSDGLDLIRMIREQVSAYLQISGRVFVEFGAEQGVEMKNIFSQIGEDGSQFTNIEVIKDYAGRDRVLSAQFAGFKRGYNG